MKAFLPTLIILSIANSLPVKKSYLRNWDIHENSGSQAHAELPVVTGSPILFPETTSISTSGTPSPPAVSELASFFSSVSDFFEEIPSAATNLTNQFSNESVVDSLKTLGTSTKDATSNLYNGAANVASKAYLAVSGAAVDTYGEVSHVAKNTYSTVSSAAVNAYSEVTKVSTNLYDKTSNASFEVYEKVADVTTSWWSSTSNWFSSAWSDTSNWISSAASSTGGFFSSSWRKVVVWWRELEDEVKEVIHIIIRVVEVAIGIAVLVAVLWGYGKVRKAYNFVKNATTDEK